jgi:hypothetical protein
MARSLIEDWLAGEQVLEFSYTFLQHSPSGAGRRYENSFPFLISPLASASQVRREERKGGPSAGYKSLLLPGQALGP